MFLLSWFVACSGEGTAPGGTVPTALCLPSPNPDAVFLGVGAGGGFGRALAGGLDVTGDGVDDVVASAPQGGTDRHGVIRLICGGECGALESPWADSAFGEALALVPDLDGDGIGEVLAGAWDANQAGEVWLVPGAVGGLGSAPVEVGPETDGAGRRVGSGDFDGDGATDLVISGYSDAWVLRGLGGLAFEDPVPVQLAGADEDLGEAVAVLGDLDGDGRDDLAIHDTTFQADVAGWWLPAGGQEAPVPFLEPGVAPWGYRLAVGVGDVDGDAVPDVVLVGNDGFALFLGAATGPVHVATYATTQRPVVTGVDWDGDGTNELAVAGQGDDLVIHRVDRAGRVEPPLAAFAMPCEALALAGSDRDGDGDEELFVGVPYADVDDGPGAGVVWVLSADPPADPPDLGPQDEADLPIAGAGIDRTGCQSSPWPGAAGWMVVLAACGLRRRRQT